LLLEGELDVDERCQSLNGAAVLRMVEEVAVAALEERIPVEDVELRGWLAGLGAVLCEAVGGLERLRGRSGLSVESHGFGLYFVVLNLDSVI
jgi:hypothetical protein